MKHRDERIFGLIMAIFSAGIGIWHYLTEKAISVTWLIASFALLMLCLLAPWTLRPFSRRWHALSHFLGIVNTHLLLGLVYFLLITPIAAMARIFGYDPMQLRDLTSPSYWHTRQERFIPDSLKDQF